MANLSNFFRLRDPAPPGSAVCRPAHREEIESALRLILADDSGLAGDEAVLDFLAFSLQRQIDVNQIWVAVAGNTIVWALLPIASPGRTMLLFTPNRLPRATPLEGARELTDRLCDHWRGQGIHLAQLLIDPADSRLLDLYVSCGFEVLAELTYLQKRVRGTVPIELPAGLEVDHYDTITHPAFARAVLRSYESSLDCPRLNGRRHIEDVICGHKATGLFDPRHWYLLSEQGQERGVLILSPSQNQETVELVYLGLCPEARGRGLGNLLMGMALNAVAGLGRQDLSLAVDARNTPALRLYYRYGLKQIGSRLALLRDVRSAPVPATV